MIGRTLGHFRVVETIGEGGMGVVYRARDLHLERDVAIKVLPPGLLSDETARRRFRREALALSRLQHPGIAVVHDFDAVDGADFLAMELMPGGTLATRLAPGPMPIADALQVGIQVAAALDAAHAAGVVHRDLKPSNIMFSADGHAKVLDFGLARRAHDPGEASITLTQSQAVMGTLRYMAPEQLRGESADARTDVFGLGVVLYEMVTGRLPHDETQSIAFAAAVLNQPPISPGLRREGLPPALEAVILRALAKDPSERFPTARAMREALEAAASGTAAPPARPAVGSSRAGIPVVAVVATAMAVVIVGGWALRSCVPASGRIQSLAVLPLVNLSGDPRQEYFADGMTDELIEDLSQIQALRVISRTSAMSYKGSRKKLPQIARELGVEGVVEGSIVRYAGRVRVNAQLVRAGDERSLWARSFERPIGDLLALQNDIARVIADQVQVELRPAERLRLNTAARVDSEAAEACMKCLYYQNMSTTDGFRQAIEWGNKAISLDPGYARAYAALSAAYALSSSASLPATEAMPRARAAAQRALALDSAQVEARVQLAYVDGFFDWHWSDAERQLRRAIATSPGSASAHWTYGYLLTVTRRFDEAARELREAHRLDPLSQGMTAAQLWPLYEGRHFADAAFMARQFLATDPSNLPVRLVLGQALYMLGDTAAAVTELRRVAAADPMFKSPVVYVLARSGRRIEATRMRDSLQVAVRDQFTQPYYFALMHVGFGERDAAFTEFDRAVREHSEELAFLQVDPFLDPIRADPRFAALLRRVGFGS